MHEGRTVEDARRLGILEHLVESLTVLRDREAAEPGSVDELLVEDLQNAVNGWHRLTGMPLP